MACLGAPWLTRALLLLEKGLPMRPADLRGLFADGAVGLTVVGLIGIALLARRAWGRVAAWLVFVAFVAATFGIYEVVSVFDSLYALGHLEFLADVTFIRGSVLHMRHPLLLFAILAMGTLGILWARAPAKPWWRGWGAALVVCVFGHAALPLSHYYDGWRQRHAIHAYVSTLPASRGLEAGTVGAEVRQVFRGDLGGERWIEPLPGQPNVLLILVEAVSGASLPSVAKEAGVKSVAPMPKLDALAKDHILFTHVVSHQRQTNRGEYGILCGDYPKLLTDQSKMTEQVYGEPTRCLPAVLRDAGYRTAYIQAAPLGFMLKDQFMPKAGFEELVGDSSFQESYARTDWGVDDKAFFEQALGKIVELHQADPPFFATLLTVGTHHPFTFPEEAVNAPKKNRRARAFQWADEALSELVTALEERGILRDTVVIITSDESAGLVKTHDRTQRLLSQSWSFAVVMLPEAQTKRVDTLVAHVDTALSITDLLGLQDHAAGFVGRSWFRDYNGPRKLFAGNTYSRRVIMWQPGSAVICDESFYDCSRVKVSSFKASGRSKPAKARERRLLAEVSRLTRSGRATMAPSETMTLLRAEEVMVPAADGKKLLAGGQYLRVAAGTTLHIDFDLEVYGNEAEVELHQDVFLDGHEQFARDKVRLRDGQRWQLGYEIGVPKDSSQLVVQLYATTVSGERANIRLRRAELVMRRDRSDEKEVRVNVDEVSSIARR